MGTVEAVRTAIRPCRRDDLARIAEIHKAQFLAPGTLLAHLSPTLIAAFYEAFLDRSIFLLHSSDGEVDGFVLGGPSRAMMCYRLSFLRRRALFCLAEVVRRPYLCLPAFRSLVRLLENWFASKIGAAPCDEFRLVSIAVAARAKRKGVATALVETFESAVRAQCRAYSLNVLKSNAAAMRFYETLAFQRVGETALSWTLRKELAAPARGD